MDQAATTANRTDIRNRTVVITGAGSGVGEATALLFAAEGARCVLVGRSRESLEQTAAQWTGAPAMALYRADVADAAAVSRLQQQIASDIGEVDVVVSCAGINVTARGVFDTSIEDFDSIFAVNTRGPFNLIRAFGPAMKERKSGTIAVVSSIAGCSLPATVAGVAYSASKAAVLVVTAFAREELRPFGVNVSSYCPGVINTPILDRRASPPSPEQRAAFLQPEDCAQDLLHICTRPARGTVLSMVSVPGAQAFACDMAVGVAEVRGS